MAERISVGSGQDAVDRAVAFFGEIDDLRAGEDQPMLAEPWERFLARIIDVAIVMAVFYVLASFYLYPGAVRLDGDATIPDAAVSLVPPQDSIGVVIAQTAYFAALFAIYELATSRFFGVTLGKRIVNLEVRGPGGRPVTVRRLAGRTLAWVLVLAPALLLYATSPTSLLIAVPLVAAVVMTLRDDLRRTWYDRLAKTSVVKPR